VDTIYIFLKLFHVRIFEYIHTSPPGFELVTANSHAYLSFVPLKTVIGETKPNPPNLPRGA
jgi:hypothetical protein